MRLSATPRLPDKFADLTPAADSSLHEVLISMWNDLGRLLPSVDFLGVVAGAPSTPPAQTYYVYVDSADGNKLKVKGPGGTVTPLANP